MGKGGADRIPEYTTISEVARATGMNQKTIRKRISNLEIHHSIGMNNFFRTADVLKNIYIMATDPEKSELNLTHEKAGYYCELKLKTRLEREKLSEKYVDAESFHLSQMKRFLAFREKLLNVSARLGPKVSRKDPQTATDLISEALAEALKELVGEEVERLRLQQEDTGKDDSSRDQPADEPSASS